jgi:hypothetical protein
LFVVSHFWTGTLSAAWPGEAVNAIVSAANAVATDAAVTRLAVRVGGVMSFPPDKASAMARTVADAHYRDFGGDDLRSSPSQWQRIPPGWSLHEF